MFSEPLKLSHRHSLSVRQCGPRKEWELICIETPKVSVSFDLVVAALEVCSKEEIFRNVDKALCVKLFIAQCFFGIFVCLFALVLAGKIIFLTAGK